VQITQKIKGVGTLGEGGGVLDTPAFMRRTTLGGEGGSQNHRRKIEDTETKRGLKKPITAGVRIAKRRTKASRPRGVREKLNATVAITTGEVQKRIRVGGELKGDYSFKIP